MKSLFIGIFLLTYLTCWSQEMKTIKGVVTDHSSGEPLPFASISLKNTPLSTVTNLQGEFTFHFPAEFINDTLEISMLGFAVLEQLVNTLPPSKNSFTLRQSEKILEGIVITDTLSANEIIKLALERIPVNYPTLPVSMTAFYRETQQVDSSYVSLVEAALTIYEESKSKKSGMLRKAKLKVDHLRRSLSFPHKYNDWWDTHNLLMATWGLNPVPYAYHTLRKGDFRREMNTELNGEPIYVISDQQLGTWGIRLYVQAKTYAIVRIEEHYDPAVQGEKIWPVHHKTLEIKAYPIYRDLVIEFRKYKGHFYLNTVRFHASHTYVVDTGEKTDFGIKQDIIVNEITLDNPTKILKNEAQRFNSTLINKKYTYDAEFWDTYNVIKETPLEEELIKDLEKEVSLYDQFQSHPQK